MTVQTTILNGRELTIERNEMSGGVYLIYITDDKGNTKVKKMIIN